MPRPIWKGAITFGMISIPVKLYGATESKDLAFNTLHNECKSRLKQKRWCPVHDREVFQDEVVRAFVKGGFADLSQVHVWNQQFVASSLEGRRYDTGDKQGPYAGDDKATSSANKVDALIKSLRENNWDATRFVKKGKKFGNVPNVWAELGSVWRSVMHDPDQAAHLLGKLITFVGPKRFHPPPLALRRMIRFPAIGELPEL